MALSSLHGVSLLPLRLMSKPWSEGPELGMCFCCPGAGSGCTHNINTSWGGNVKISLGMFCLVTFCGCEESSLREKGLVWAQVVHSQKS